MTLFKEKPMARELQEKKELGLERGKNVHIKVTFSRHEEPGKTPEGMSADWLTEQGIKKAVERGKEIPHKLIMVFGSKKVKRARETAALELESAVDSEGMAEAANTKMKPELEERPGREKFAKGDFIIYRRGDLDPVAGLKEMWLEGGRKAGEAVEKGEIPEDQKTTYQYEYFLNNPDRAKELGAQTAKGVAEEMANRIYQCLAVSGRLYEGIDLNVRNYSHGPRLEAVLKHVLRQESGKLGFDKLEDIGGPFKPGESFDLDVERDEKGELKSVKVSRGDKVLGTLDLTEVKELMEKYREREKEEEK